MKFPILCSMGGGFSSTAWLPRILLEKYSRDQLHFFTCVLPNEHPSMWELFDAVEKELNIKVTYVAYDKTQKFTILPEKELRSREDCLWTPFDIFDDVKFIGNSRRDPCSSHLKRKTAQHYVQTFFPNATMAVGIHVDEMERMANIYDNWMSKGYEVIFPLIDEIPFSTEDQIKLLKEWYGVSLPLYELGFEHNNCHGACVKAGQRQWALFWYYFPEKYMDWENREALWREQHGNFTILKKKVAGVQVYMTLTEFRQYLEKESTDPTTFLGKFIQELPGNPPCFYCSSI